MQQYERISIFFVGVLGSIISLASVLLPGMIFVLLLLPLPYIHLIKKYGHRSGTLAILLTAIINSMVLSIMGMIFTLVTFGLTAVLVGGAFYENYKPTRIAVISVFASVASGLLLYFLSIRFGFVDELRTALDNPTFWNNLTKSGVKIESKKEFIDSLMMLLPGMVFSFSLALGLLNYYLSAAWLKRQKFEVEKLPPIREWGFTRLVGFGYILVEVLPGDPVMVNIGIAFLSILVVQGIAFTAYYTDRWGVYPWVRIAIMAVGFLFLWFVFFIFGLVDNLFRLRGIPKKVEIQNDDDIF